MRRAKIDSNQPDIVTAFEGRGATVQSLARVGDNCPDLLIGIFGINIVAEVKSHPAGTVAGEPSEGQAEWIKNWRGLAVVVRSLEDVGRVCDMAAARSRKMELP
jgi:hypothetical protein